MNDELKRYFIPSAENDHKPHALKRIGITALIAVAFVFFGGTALEHV